MIDPEILTGFESISLEDMGKVKLMNRIDTKFVADIKKVAQLLELAKSSYMIQEINGQFNMPYYTCYYDTPDTDMYYQHQRGKKTRQKIRKRIYEGADSLTFLEIKSKNNKGRTKKKRVNIEDDKNMMEYADFLQDNSQYFPQNLVPHIENHFFRITLVNHDMTERITIDTQLEFNNLKTGMKTALPQVGIIEWKRDRLGAKSPLKELLMQLRIHEGSFSKYCIGMALTNPQLPQNRLKKRLRIINKIQLANTQDSESIL